MPPRYSKPHKSLDEQLELLERRGLVITDRSKAKNCLRRIGYYRLSAYSHPFRLFDTAVDPATGAATVRTGPTGTPLRLDTFQAGTELAQVVDLYVFDKRLRLLMLDAIERVEVALRSDIAYYMGHLDTFAYENRSLFDRKFISPDRRGKVAFDDWQAKYAKLLHDARNEDFVAHFHNRYDGKLPIWVAVEVWNFGTLSHFYRGMAARHKDAIAGKYGVLKRETFGSWIRSINYVRNICSHHSRLWNRNLIDQPRLPDLGDIPVLDHLHAIPKVESRVYSVVAILAYLMQFINPDSNWPARVRALIDAFPEGGDVNIGQMGFPPPGVPAIL